MLWSVSKLARSVTKWTPACDRRVARLTSHIHHTNDFRQCYCHVGNTPQHCRLGLFRNWDLAGDLEDSQSTSRGGLVYFFGSRTFVLVSLMCQKQTAVSHSSTESEIISLDAGLRMDGLLALDLWDIVVKVLRSTNKNVQPNHTSTQETDATLLSKAKTQKVKMRQVVVKLSDVDYVPTNTHWTKSDDETRVQNQQSCSWLVVRQNQFGTQSQNQICEHQRPTRWYSDQRKFLEKYMESPSVFVQYYEFIEKFL